MPSALSVSPALPFSIRQHTAAYVSIRQHTAAYVAPDAELAERLARTPIQHTAAYGSIRQHTSAAYVSIRQHTSHLMPSALSVSPALASSFTLTGRGSAGSGCSLAYVYY
jgi:hypothetical protein